MNEERQGVFSVNHVPIRNGAATPPIAQHGPLPVPQPAQPISIRVATLEDYPFIDALQKQHTKMVGWMPRQQLENYITNGDVLIAEGRVGVSPARIEESSTSPRQAAPGMSTRPSPRSLGYMISRDRYFKRDDVGIVYQLNVAPGSRRGLIGATLLKEVFARAAWGCKLFCCWCA